MGPCTISTHYGQTSRQDAETYFDAMDQCDLLFPLSRVSGLPTQKDETLPDRHSVELRRQSLINNLEEAAKSGRAQYD